MLSCSRKGHSGTAVASHRISWKCMCVGSGALHCWSGTWLQLAIRQRVYGRKAGDRKACSRQRQPTSPGLHPPARPFTALLVRPGPCQWDMRARVFLMFWWVYMNGTMSSSRDMMRVYAIYCGARNLHHGSSVSVFRARVWCMHPLVSGFDSAQGVDGMAEIPFTRWELEDFWDPNPDIAGKMCLGGGPHVALGAIMTVLLWEPIRTRSILNPQNNRIPVKNPIQNQRFLNQVRTLRRLLTSQFDIIWLQPSWSR